jgi:hypothetical protein
MNLTHYIICCRRIHSIMTSLEFLAAENCTWHLIPPKTPQFGGLSEAAVKSMEFHL